MKRKISDKDKKDWKNFISNKEKLSNKDLYLSNNKIEKEIIKTLEKLDDNVEFQGYLPNEKVKELMSKSSILVVPSVWQEPFGMTAIEGLSNKMALVGSDVGGLSEIINFL